ncbi:MAG TPA: SCO family protein [Balneolales bacterium]|nr:SCO family protein [Balneolales bacterium]
MSKDLFPKIVIILLVGLVALIVYQQFGNSERTFSAKGRIMGFGSDPHTVIIAHEDIPGYMKAMTMKFYVTDTTNIQSLNIGDAVGFSLHVNRDSAWVSNLHQIADSLVSKHPGGDDLPKVEEPKKSKKLGKDDKIPAVQLLDQDNHPINFKSFRGMPIIMTFFYTRCPLPNYCPLMSKNLQYIQPILKKKYGNHFHLFSISFDTRNDTPATLKKYSENYTNDLKTWSFVTGTPKAIGKLTAAFGVFYEYGGKRITHNLRTVVVDPEGRVFKIFRGNSWSPKELVKAVDQIMKSENKKVLD